MKTRIDIKTPAGKSLEGFPKEIEGDKDENHLWSIFHHLYYGETLNPALTKGDIITIEVL